MAFFLSFLLAFVLTSLLLRGVFVLARGLNRAANASYEGLGALVRRRAAKAEAARRRLPIEMAAPRRGGLRR